VEEYRELDAERVLADLGLPSELSQSPRGITTAIPLIAEGSFTQFGGGLDLLGRAPAFAWILLLSIVMARQSPGESD
jgi:hypothetical protein